MSEHAANPLFLLPFGIFIGILSGLTGLGGGAVMVPALVLLFGFDQHKAQGTSLGVIFSPMLFPAIYRYWREDSLSVVTAVWMLPGVLIGSFLGGWIATAIDEKALKVVFGFVLVYFSGYIVFSIFAEMKLALILSGALMVVALGLMLVARFAS